MGSPESRPLGIPSATIAAVSSSDQLAVLQGCEHVFLVDCAGTLSTVNLAGGSPRNLAEHVSYADWSLDGKQLAIVVNTANDARLEFPPGHVLYQQKTGWLGHPRFSPDGSMIAFENHPVDSDDGSIDVVDLNGKRTIVTQGWLSIEGMAWRPDGKEIWFAGTLNSAGWADAIHAVTLSGKERTVVTVPDVRLHDIAPDGRVLLSRENWRTQLIGFFPGDTAEHAYAWLDDTSPTALSNDGRWLSFGEAGEIYYLENDRLAYYRRTDGSAAVSLGAGQADISPDGKWILTYGRGKPKLLLQPVGPGEPRELPTPGLTFFDRAAWSDDGSTVAYEALDSQADWNVYAQKINGGPPVLVKTKGRDSDPTISPDGATLALHEETGGISLYRAGTSQPTVLKGVLGAESPIRFVGGGRSLLVGDSNSKDVTFTLIDLATAQRKPWKHLHFSVQRKGKGIVVTPDLKYYAYYSPRYSSNLYLVENLH